MKTPATLKICVSDEIVMREGTAPSAVKRAIPSPYFQPEVRIRVGRMSIGPSGKPRGPTVTIDMGDLMAAFE